MFPNPINQQSPQPVIYPKNGPWSDDQSTIWTQVTKMHKGASGLAKQRKKYTKSAVYDPR